MLSWVSILRLGLAQMSLGAIIVLMTSTLNRVMVVEMALPAFIPGLLMGWRNDLFGVIANLFWGLNNIAAMIGRSWVIISSAELRSATAPLSNRRTCFWTVTSSAVVGSSAMISCG